MAGIRGANSVNRLYNLSASVRDSLLTKSKAKCRLCTTSLHLWGTSLTVITCVILLEKAWFQIMMLSSNGKSRKRVNKVYALLLLDSVKLLLRGYFSIDSSSIFFLSKKTSRRSCIYSLLRLFPSRSTDFDACSSEVPISVNFT